MSDYNLKRSFFNIIFVLFVSVTALGISLFLYIYWFVSVKDGLMALVHKFNVRSEDIFAPETWIVIFILSCLVSLILLCITVIYIYFQKTLNLYRLQKNFIRGFTHELKTPVTSIQLYIDTFVKHELNRNAQLKYLDYMQKDVKRLSSQIKRILNLARLESRMEYLNFERVELAAFINAVWNTYPNIKNSLNLEIDKKKVFVSIDKGLFEMLLINIFNNAIKYNDNKEPFIKVFFIEKNRKLEIVFADNGIGMKNRDCKRVFKQFYQVRKNGSNGGTGIGLYLAQMIAKRHKGSIKAKSEGLNRGTMIILSLKNGDLIDEEDSYN